MTTKPKKCECREVALRTLLDVSATHYQCPRCGGLVPKKRKVTTGKGADKTYRFRQGRT